MCVVMWSTVTSYVEVTTNICIVMSISKNLLFYFLKKDTLQLSLAFKIDFGGEINVHIYVIAKLN